MLVTKILLQQTNISPIIVFFCKVTVTFCNSYLEWLNLPCFPLGCSVLHGHRSCEVLRCKRGVLSPLQFLLAITCIGLRIFWDGFTRLLNCVTCVPGFLLSLSIRISIWTTLGNGGWLRENTCRTSTSHQLVLVLEIATTNAITIK